MTRGRPPQQMTHNRQRVFDQVIAALTDGEAITYAAISRRCGINNYRNTRRTIRDLRKMGRL